jgi:hypothetical protein
VTNESGKGLSVLGIGTVILSARRKLYGLGDDQIVTVHLENVLHVPGAESNAVGLRTPSHCANTIGVVPLPGTRLEHGLQCNGAHLINVSCSVQNFPVSELETLNAIGCPILFFQAPSLSKTMWAGWAVPPHLSTSLRWDNPQIPLQQNIEIQLHSTAAAKPSATGVEPQGAGTTNASTAQTGYNADLLTKPASATILGAAGDLDALSISHSTEEDGYESDSKMSGILLTRSNPGSTAEDEFTVLSSSEYESDRESGICLLSLSNISEPQSRKIDFDLAKLPGKVNQNGDSSSEFELISAEDDHDWESAISVLDLDGSDTSEAEAVENIKAADVKDQPQPVDGDTSSPVQSIQISTCLPLLSLDAQGPVYLPLQEHDMTKEWANGLSSLRRMSDPMSGRTEEPSSAKYDPFEDAHGPLSSSRERREHPCGGKAFYIDDNTRRITWTRPVIPAEQLSSGKYGLCEGRFLPGWECRVDNLGRTYYANHANRSTRGTGPTSNPSESNQQLKQLSPSACTYPPNHDRKGQTPTKPRLIPAEQGPNTIPSQPPNLLAEFEEIVAQVEWKRRKRVSGKGCSSRPPSPVAYVGRRSLGVPQTAAAGIDGESVFSA